MNTKGSKTQKATEDLRMDNQLTIPNRCHNTTGIPLSNKIGTSRYNDATATITSLKKRICVLSVIIAIIPTL